MEGAAGIKAMQVRIAATRTTIFYPLRVTLNRHSGFPYHSSVSLAGGQHGARSRPQPEV